MTESWVEFLIGNSIRDKPSFLESSAAPSSIMPAEAIRAAVLDGRFSDSRRGLRLVGGRVRGDVDLSLIECSRPISMHYCRLGNIRLDNGSFSSVSLIEVVCNSLRANDTRIEGDLSLDRSEIAGFFWGRSLKASGTLSMDKCVVAGSAEAWRGSQTPQPEDSPALLLDGARLGDWTARQTQIRGTVSAVEVEAGEVVLHGLSVFYPEPGVSAVCLDSAQIRHLAAENLSITGELRGIGMRVEGSTHLDDGSFLNPFNDALTLDGATFGRLTLTGSQIDGRARLVQASVTSDLLMERVEVRNLGDMALNMNGLHVGRNMNATLARLQGQVRAQEIRVGGQAIFRRAVVVGSDLPWPGSAALVMDGATIGSGLLCHHIEVQGGLRLRDASIGIRLTMIGARLSSTQKDCLEMSRTQIRGDFIAAGIEILGGAFMEGLDVKGRIGLRGASLFANTGRPRGVPARPGRAAVAGSATHGTRRAGVALDLSALTCTSSVNLGESVVRGQTRIRDARLTGGVNLENVYMTLSGVPGTARSRRVDLPAVLILDRSEIQGTVRTNDIDWSVFDPVVLAEVGPDSSAPRSRGTVIVGGVRATDVKCARLTLTGLLVREDVADSRPRPSGPSAPWVRHEVAPADVDWLGERPTGIRHSVVLRSAVVGSLELGGTLDGVDLTSAQIDLLLTPPRRRGPGGRSRGRRVGHSMDRLGSLSAQGWRLRDVRGVIGERETAARRWLETDPRFTAQPWGELAEVFERNARPGQARRLRYWAAQRTTREAAWTHQVWARLYGRLAGHGHYPMRTAFALVAVIVITASLSTVFAGSFVPTQPERAVVEPRSAAAAEDAAETATGATPCARLVSYPCFSPWSFAVNTATPTNAVTTVAWAPDSRSPAPLQLVLTMLKVLGWLLVVMFLAGVTGLLRRR